MKLWIEHGQLMDGIGEPGELMPREHFGDVGSAGGCLDSSASPSFVARVSGVTD